MKLILHGEEHTHRFHVLIRRGGQTPRAAPPADGGVSPPLAAEKKKNASLPPSDVSAPGAQSPTAASQMQMGQREEPVSQRG